MFKKKKKNSSTTAGWETNRIIHSSGFRVKLSAEEGKRRESDISQRLVTRSLTCFCCAFTVQHLQDVFGDFLDGVPRLVSQFAHAVQNHQPLVALMAGALLLRERRTNKCKWEVIPKWMFDRTARRELVQTQFTSRAVLSSKAHYGAVVIPSLLTCGMGKWVAYWMCRGCSYSWGKAGSRPLSLQPALLSWSRAGFSGDGLPLDSQCMGGENICMEQR